MELMKLNGNIVRLDGNIYFMVKIIYCSWSSPYAWPWNPSYANSATSSAFPRSFRKNFSRNYKVLFQATETWDPGDPGDPGCSPRFGSCAAPFFEMQFWPIGKWGKVFLSKTWESKHQHSFLLQSIRQGSLWRRVIKSTRTNRSGLDLTIQLHMISSPPRIVNMVGKSTKHSCIFVHTFFFIYEMDPQ